MDSSDLPLVRHLLTCWWPAWQPNCIIHIPAYEHWWDSSLGSQQVTRQTLYRLSYASSWSSHVSGSDPLKVWCGWAVACRIRQMSWSILSTTQQHPAGRALTSDWSADSFTMFILENVLVALWTDTLFVDQSEVTAIPAAWHRVQRTEHSVSFPAAKHLIQ